MKDIFHKKRWEGKPLGFKLKYLYANYPGITIALATFICLPTFLGTYRFYTFEGSRQDVTKKYKINYTVVRDDDPRINEIIAEKEAGRHYFPNY